jgi:hypothetical protein
MLTLLKARLRDPRTWTIAAYVAILALTGWLGPKVGLRGEELRMVLSGQGGVGMLLAWLLKSPLQKDAKPSAEEPSGDSGESDE